MLIEHIQSYILASRPEQELQGAVMFVQRPAQRRLAQLVELLHGAEVLGLLVARRGVRRRHELGQRLHQVHLGRLLQRHGDKRRHGLRPPPGCETVWK